MIGHPSDRHEMTFMKNHRSKMPWCQAYAADHLADPELSACSPATRGVWVDWVCHMHLNDRCGEVCGTAEQLGRLGRCSPSEVVEAVADLERTGAADVARVTGGNENETATFAICNRRMRREYLARKSNSDRQMRHRDRKRHDESNAEVALESRDRGQKLDIKPPPPAENTVLKMHSAAWGAVEAELFSIGMAEASSAIAEAAANGIIPSDVEAIVAHWRSRQGAWGVGALRHRIGIARPGMLAGEHWPAVDAGYARRQAGDRVLAQTMQRRAEGEARKAALTPAELEERRRVLAEGRKHLANGKPPPVAAPA